LKEVTFVVCKWQGNHHVEGRFNWDNYTPAGSQRVKDIKVPATTLSQIIFNIRWSRIDLLKIDTEGAEPEILKDIKPFLKNVKHLAIEWHSQSDLVKIKEALWDTHVMVIEEGAFHEPSGAVANGNIVATLSEGGSSKTAPKLIKTPQQHVPSSIEPVPYGSIYSSCCNKVIAKEGDKWYCSSCHRLAVTNRP
jgi:hypothetical protein